MWFTEKTVLQAANMETSRSWGRTLDNTEPVRQTAGEEIQYFSVMCVWMSHYLFWYLCMCAGYFCELNIFVKFYSHTFCISLRILLLRSKIFVLLLSHSFHFLYTVYIPVLCIFTLAVTSPTLLSGLHFPEVSGYSVPLWRPAFHQQRW